MLGGGGGHRFVHWGITAVTSQRRECPTVHWWPQGGTRWADGKVSKKKPAQRRGTIRQFNKLPDSRPPDKSQRGQFKIQQRSTEGNGMESKRLDDY